ncbi:MAG TPA: hypothetical protein VF855_13585 [Acidimicrobiales bacterium]
MWRQRWLTGAALVNDGGVLDVGAGHLDVVDNDHGGGDCADVGAGVDNHVHGGLRRR